MPTIKILRWKKPIIIGLWIVAFVGIIAVATGYFSSVSIDVLQPKGVVANQQKQLIIFTLALALIIIIPVFTMLFVFAWKYRETNHEARYTPEWDGNKWLELVWWGIPCVIIGILGVITWQTSHSLDPYKQLTSDVKPVKVQVVALQWKWLFIYPELGIATTNDLRFPEKTPVNFELTSDAPMNSFWIPSLGSQVYAMSGMSTKLHLMADSTGMYRGASTNISGDGYADMAFTARSLSRADFDTWVGRVKATGGALDADRYAQLAKPATIKEPGYFDLKNNGLYDDVVMKYMMPSQTDRNAAVVEEQ